MEDKQLKLKVTDDAKNQIIEQGFDVSYGARPLKRFIQSMIEVLVAKTMLSTNIKPNSTLIVDVKDGEFFVNIK